jgi:hypothetical protein
VALRPGVVLSHPALEIPLVAGEQGRAKRGRGGPRQKWRLVLHTEEERFGGTGRWHLGPAAALFAEDA